MSSKQLLNNNTFEKNRSEIVDELFNVMPYLFWKNRDGIYLGCNYNQAKAFNFKSPEAIIGKTIFEIIDDHDAAEKIDSVDNHIMNSGELLIVEEQVPTKFGIKTYISQKQPIRNKNSEIIGLLGFAMDITEIKEKETAARTKADELMKENHKLEVDYYKKLTEQQSLFKECLSQLQHIINSYKIKGLHQKLGFNPKSDNLTANIKLTKREEEILYYLSLNKSPKEISTILSSLGDKSIQPSTIQAIIDKQLYVKFNVYSISQLVENAIMLNLIPFMPDQHQR